MAKQTAAKLKREAEIRTLAKNTIEKEGEIEIDDGAVISEAEECNGAYVQSWAWVDFAGTPLDKACPDCDGMPGDHAKHCFYNKGAK